LLQSTVEQASCLCIVAINRGTGILPVYCCNQPWNRHPACVLLILLK
jgi:hypothetical protein